MLGVLTVRETIAYALRLSVVNTPMKTRDIDELVNTTITSLGLKSVENNRIGNVIQRGISGGQKRRVTVGTSLVTNPKVSLPEEFSTVAFVIDNCASRYSSWMNQRLVWTAHRPVKSWLQSSRCKPNTNPKDATLTILFRCPQCPGNRNGRARFYPSTEL